MSSYKKRILLTGGAGFIGSNLTKRLLDSGIYHVTSIDNFDAFYPREQKKANIARFVDEEDYLFIEGDITRVEDLEQLANVDVIIHLAAKAGVRESIQNSRLFHEVNVMGTHNVLEFAKNNNIGQFIQASSSSVYGTNPNVPWREIETLNPISPYASSKLSNEMLGQVYSHLYGIRFLAIRFFTVYGPGQRPDLAIFNFFDNIINQRPISVFGNGETFRDYTHIDDIVKGIMAAIEYSQSDYEVINLGCSSPVTLNDLIARIEFLCKKKAIINRFPEQPGDVYGTFADISKAADLLNYFPEVNLDMGLAKFYDWFVSKEGNLKSKTQISVQVS